MLFEAHLKVKEAYYSKDWGDVPLKYGQLKSLIHEALETSDEGNDQFFTFLKKEIARINKRFLKLAQAAVRQHGRCGHRLTNDSEKRNGFLSDWIHGWDLQKKFMRNSSERSQSRICNEFARVNSVAVRKILKKYDKVLSSTEGSDFWMSLWRDQSKDVSFLHSPLRLQIDAIESTAASITTHSHDGTGASAFDPKCRFLKNDLQCPICLDVLYQPVALSCGHVYCLPCLLEACHLGNAVGTVRALMSNISPDEPCSKCRQKNVYRNAALLPELDRYVQLQHLAAWNERDANEKRVVAEKKQKLLEQRKRQAHEPRRFHPFLVLK